MEYEKANLPSVLLAKSKEPYKICPLLEPIFSPITDDHNHHATYEVQLVDILWGAPTGVTLHHWWCMSKVIHPVASPVNQTTADTYTLPYT